MQFIGVRGSGEHSGFGHTVGSVLSHVNAQQSGVGNETINYWAVDVNPWEPKYFPDYMSSVRQGVSNLAAAVSAFRARCGSTPMILAGYSQGAEVIDHWLDSGASIQNVAGVALFGDPRFNPNNGAPIDQGSYNRSLAGVSNTYFPRVGGFGGVEHYPASWSPWLRSYCANHDQICNTSSLAALIGCGIGSNCAHYHYAEAVLGGGRYTADAADFLVSRANAAAPRPGPGGGSPTPGPGGSNPPNPGGGATPPTVQTYAETTGGVTHTWTNYSDAGGTQGPSIPSNTTVQITCKVAGFAVADGDTSWYQVASSPWNNVYYASADAFYNNGATSGSLSGTPFDDPNVPDCSGSVGGTGGAKPSPTYAETVGGVTHTWTNYSDAGGTQGPSIPSNTTVQITCKVAGFAVADGDTWWYQVASSPWNNVYYASADAFYNNGATSGSLSGTPFDDPTVPDC